MHTGTQCKYKQQFNIILDIHMQGLTANCTYVQLVLANPGGEVMKKLDKSKCVDIIGYEWIYLTVGEAVNACNYMLQSCKPKTKADESEAAEFKFDVNENS